MTGDADVAEPHPDALIGQVLANRYLIESRLGEGAMGAVYKAKHVKVGRAFAVKVLHKHLLEDPKLVKRFEREAELAGRLRHPNVIGVVDVGDLPDGTRYMVMEFAAGPDLATVMSEAPMPAPRIVHLTRQLLEGLYHAHEQGLIHRDFKPENVIIERDAHGAEVPRIVDFGIAILREGGDSTEGPGRLTTNGLVLGTPHFMAPEQAIADPIDHRIDLFALGIILYEMLSGRLPFDGSGAEVARANLLLEPPPIRERVPLLEVDPLLEAYARRLMAKKRDQRPANAKVARELLDLVERDRKAAAAALGVALEAARPPRETQDSAPQRRAASGNDTFPPPVSAVDAEPIGPRTDRRARWPIVAIAVVALGGAGAGGYALFGRGGHDEAPKRAAIEPPQQAIASTGSAAGSAAATATATGSATATPTGSATATAAGSATPSPVIVHATGKRPTKTKPAKPTTTVAAAPPPEPPKPEPPKPEPPKPEPPKPEPLKPPPAEPMDAKAFAHLYQAVGSELNAYERSHGPDAAADQRGRYRLINFSDSVGDPARRDAAAAQLRKIHSELAK
jgi:serine/threonine-protein kinase